MTKGIYCLVMRLKKGQNLRIGKNLKDFFPRGYYCYIGSALNNLEKRIERHKSKGKKKHWHVDYLTDKANVIEVLKIETKDKREECELSRKITRVGGITILNGFGSSDCKCETHLFYFNENPLENEDLIGLFYE